ncbi:PadR family transcriptional regulator [Pseudoxanthomonas sp.]|uniref:PadR family transcriptional regulator n=1 Tax=Pseudoxanthomonas sp. TaxID=1871049 RepID=UPI0026372AB4|nr:PadR family transcriptional regulator [Pseudoxanthomonas sp.]WDS34767.1 MAG: PadR family transcriptional regulator [Pseudoxanthomonas sp.]
MHPRTRHHGPGGRLGELFGHAHGRIHRGEGHGRPAQAEGRGRAEGDDAPRAPDDLVRASRHGGHERGERGGRHAHPDHGRGEHSAHEARGGERGHGRRGGRRGDGAERQRTPRVLAHGDLRLLLLALLEAQPRHGYELIQLIGEMFHGQYAPSAGAVYPALAQLQELGLVEASEDGARRLHALTDAGRAFAHENADALVQARLRTEHSARVLVKAGMPAPVRAGLGALKRSLASHHEQWKGDIGEQVAEILLRAAADIARVGRG